MELCLLFHKKYPAVPLEKRLPSFKNRLPPGKHPCGAHVFNSCFRSGFCVFSAKVCSYNVKHFKLCVLKPRSPALYFIEEEI
jgi:hypothetical protein